MAMRTSCESHNPKYINYCDSYIGQTKNSKDFCTNVGNDKKMKDYCSNIGDGEWEYAGQGDTCEYNSGKNGSWVPTNCGISGRSASCKRKKFTGDAAQCCLNDMYCNSQNSSCYSDSNEMNTCAPEYRNMASSSCRDITMNYCSGEDVPSDKSQIWINRWIAGDKLCYKNIYRNLYAGNRSVACVRDPIPNLNIPVDPSGFNYDQDLMNKMINRYIQDGGDLASSESSETNTQLNCMIWEICSTTPGLCDKALFSYCSNVTPDSLLRNNSLLNWCGCYMQPEKYSKYTELYGIQRECTPTCNMSGVLRLSNVDNTGFKTCANTTCVIDNISLNIASSSIGGINFSQICSSCSQGQEGNCNCTISGNTIDIISSQIGGSLNLNQQCSGDSTCFEETEIDGVKTNIRVPCVGNKGVNPYVEIEKQSKKNLENSILYRNFIIIGIFILLIIIIIVLWYTCTKVPEEKILKNISSVEKNV